MILQALKDYYDRKAADPNSGIAPYGFEWKEIPFIIVLDENGNPVGIEDTREGDGKKKRAKRFLVPQSVKRTVGIAANLLWDNPAYALGIWAPDPKKVSRKSEEEEKQRVADQHADFVSCFEELCAVSDDPALKAIQQFLSYADKQSCLSPFAENLELLLKDGANVTFKITRETGPVLDSQSLRNAITRLKSSSPEEPGLCIVSGDTGELERLHAAVKGVMGAQSSGANVVSFNLDAFNSYEKKQGFNAPVGKQAAFAYTTALNSLLDRNSTQKLTIGDTTTVFWAAKDEDAALESTFAAFFAEPPKDDPDRGTSAVKSLYESIRSGTYVADDSSRRFFVLGLAPNASRISVRFWIADTVSSMADKIATHFRDLEIIHGPKDKEVLSLPRLLASTAVLGKSENIPPNLAGDFMRSILEGLPYPRTLLQAAVRRNRAEQNVTYARAALIKASLNRAKRTKDNHPKEELHVSLDPENTNVGYRLGRLFATLEKIQSESHPGINATIRDRFYGAASGTPVAVFSTLMKLKNHHLSKLESTGRRVQLEKLIGEIVDGIDTFPGHLNLEDQGRFAIGYYHQNRAFYQAKNSQKTNNESTDTPNPQGELEF